MACTLADYVITPSACTLADYNCSIYGGRVGQEQALGESMRIWHDPERITPGEHDVILACAEHAGCLQSRVGSPMPALQKVLPIRRTIADLSV